MIAFLYTFGQSLFLPLFAATTSCDPNKTFFGLKPWYAYATFSGDCTYVPANGTSFTGADVWPIMAVVFEDLIIVATYVAIAYVLVGAFQIITAQGEPEKFKNARGTIINALIGLVIALVGGRLVGFIFNGIFS